MHMGLFGDIALVERGLAHARAELGLLALERLDPARCFREFLRLPERELLRRGFTARSTAGRGWESARFALSTALPEARRCV